MLDNLDECICRDVFRILQTGKFPAQSTQQPGMMPDIQARYVISRRGILIHL
jgi:hypothetical protein